MLFLCPGCQVKMGDCLSHIRKCNFCRDGKKYLGYWSEGKSQVIVTECAQTIVWSGVQSDNYVLFGIPTRVLDTNEELFYFLLFTILLAEGLTGGLKINRKCDINLTLRI